MSADLVTGSKLAELFLSRSVAIIGGTPHRRKLGAWPMIAMQQFGYTGSVTVVNPNYDEVLGYPCVSSIADLPEDVTAAMIMLPAEASVEAAAACGRRGIRHLVMGASGFGETAEGHRLQVRLEEIVEEFGLVICGPNSNGLANIRSGLALSFQPLLHFAGGPRPGRVSVLAQSGASVSAIGAALTAAGVGLCYTAACGNQLSVGLEQYLAWMAVQEDNDVIVLFIEAIQDAAALAEALDLAALHGKRVVALKIGYSDQARIAVASHTGALAGSYQNAVAFLEKHGVVYVETIEDLVASARILAARHGRALGDAPATSERIAGRRVACISVSGGIGALVADTLSRSGVELEQPSARASARLCEVGAASETVNPYDLAGRSDHKTVSEILAILAQDGFDSVVVAEGLLPDEIREPISRAVLDQAHHFNLVALYSVAVPDGERKDFADAGVVVSDSLTSLLRSIATSDGPALRTEPIQDVVSPAPPSGSGLVDESRTKAYLSTLGIRVPRGEVIRTSSSEVPLPGIRPVVLKGVSSLLAHKSDLGLVRVGVHSDAEVLSEIQRLRALLQEVDPTADGVLVEEMIVGGIEAMVGCVRDPLFGPVLVVGFGGVLIEVVRDNAIVIAPASRGEVRAALGKTAILGVLEGHRGKIYDVDALLDVAMAVQNACIANPQIESFELNPVFVLEKGNGAIAADAKLELSSSSHERNGR